MEEVYLDHEGQNPNQRAIRQQKILAVDSITKEERETPFFDVGKIQTPHYPTEIRDSLQKMPQTQFQFSNQLFTLIQTDPCLSSFYIREILNLSKFGNIHKLDKDNIIEHQYAEMANITLAQIQQLLKTATQPKDLELLSIEQQLNSIHPYVRPTFAKAIHHLGDKNSPYGRIQIADLTFTVVHKMWDLVNKVVHLRPNYPNQFTPQLKAVIAAGIETYFNEHLTQKAHQLQVQNTAIIVQLEKIQDIVKSNQKIAFYGQLEDERVDIHSFIALYDQLRQSNDNQWTNDFAPYKELVSILFGLQIVPATHSEIREIFMFIMKDIILLNQHLLKKSKVYDMSDFHPTETGQNSQLVIKFRKTYSSYVNLSKYPQLAGILLNQTTHLKVKKQEYYAKRSAPDGALRQILFEDCKLSS